MTLWLCKTFLRRSLRFSTIRKLTTAPEQAPLYLRISGDLQIIHSVFTVLVSSIDVLMFEKYARCQTGCFQFYSTPEIKPNSQKNNNVTHVIDFILPVACPLFVHFTGCSVFRPQTIRKCLFHCTPASLVSSDAFLDRLQKGRAVVSDEGLFHHSVSVPSDSGKNVYNLSKLQDCCFRDNVGKQSSLNLILMDTYDVIALSLN